jgi:RNA polymerase sigma-70 factor (ECF subfamily)
MSSMPRHDPVEVEELATQVVWVRNLALAVARDARSRSSGDSHSVPFARAIRDAHAADDLAQDAWVAALRRRPDASEPLAAWFSRVMRNLVRFKARSDAHRTEREEHAAKLERDESPALAMQRMETQEELLRAVRKLDEPYRTTVILRWFEGLEPVEIARRSNVPVRTVHTRITRALRMLRERLDRSSRGDRSAWMSAWIPLLSKPAAHWPWILAMDAKLKIAIAGVAAIGALTALYVALPAPRPLLLSGASSNASRGSELDTSTSGASAIETRTTAADVARPAADSQTVVAKPTDSSLFEFDALVLDPTGSPLADLDVEFRASASSAKQSARTGADGIPSSTVASASKAIEHARSGADGIVHLAVAIPNGTLAPVSNEWTTVLEPKIQPFRYPSRYVLVVAHPISLAGTVVDERKHPIAGAEVRCSPPPIRERLTLVLDDCAWIAWKAITDADGRFQLPVVPAMTDAQLATEAAGFARDSREMPLLSRTDVEIELKWPADSPAHIRGRVVDARSIGVAGAYVALGKRSTRTDAAGRFDLDLDRKLSFSIAVAKKDGTRVAVPPEIEGRTLRALKEGFLPVELSCATPSARDIDAWPDPLLLVLDAETLSISGRVVDDLGAPVADADVRVLDVTPLGEVDLEFADKRFPQNATVESLIRSRPDLHQFGWLSTKTDAQGRFVHDGLLAKSYRLRAFDPKTMALLITQPCTPPRADLELVLTNPSRRARIAGRVVDRDGQPIAGARVTPWISYAGTKDKIGLSGVPVASEVDGRFELRQLSLEVDELLVSLKDSPDSKKVQLAKEASVEAITVQMARGCHLKVDLSASSIQADSFTVVDEKGKMLGFMIQRPDNVTMTGEQSLPLIDGRSEAVGTSDAAVKLVLWMNGKQVAEIPLHLVPGQLNVIRP